MILMNFENSRLKVGLMRSHRDFEEIFEVESMFILEFVENAKNKFFDSIEI